MDPITFLQQFHPDRLWTVVAIHPEDPKKVRAETFDLATAEAARDWIARWNKSHGLYFSVNVPARRLRKKTSRMDVAWVHYLFGDFDPDPNKPLATERKRIKALLTTNLPPGVPPPTWIIDSGGGFWAFWRLREPIEVNGDIRTADELRDFNKQIEIVLGADSSGNIDRIARLPGTWNLPNARKTENGRTRTLAEVLLYEPTREYDIAEFKRAAAQGNERRVGDNTARATPPSSIDKLDEWGVDDATKCIIVEGRLPDGPEKPSRSEWLYRVVCTLLRAGVPRDVVRSVITNPSFKISASVLDKGIGIDRYTERQIDRAETEISSIFQTNDKGVVSANQYNIRVAVNKLGRRLAYDLFKHRLLIDDVYLDDAGMADLYLEIERRFGFRAGKDYFGMVAEDIARTNEVHPVHDYLDGLSWDGTPRLDHWLADYAGAEHSPYVAAVGAKVLMAAVRRVRQPGCKFDEMLVLESPQGYAKSTALAILAVHEDWLGEDLPLNADTKRQIESTMGRWIVEAGELKGMRGGEVEHLKNYLSRGIDRARLAYGRLVTEVPRQFVIIGTTNSGRYLRDSTGNRRFWPVQVGEINLDALRADRDQLWAEAAEREARGESIRLERELWNVAAVEQEARHVEDPFVSVLANALGERRGKLRSSDAWNIIGVPSGQRTQDLNDRLGEAMRQLGWRSAKRRFGGPPEYCYLRGDGAELSQKVEPGDGTSRP